TRIINAWNAGLAFRYPPGRFLTNILIADNDFENNGHAYNLPTDTENGDLLIESPVGLRILNNHAVDTDGTFFLSGTGGNPSGMGQVTVTGNSLENVKGFGIALGGGGPGTAGGKTVLIQNNNMKMSSTRENVIDVAYWSEVVIDHNYIEAGTCKGPCGAIGEAPPADKITITNNTINTKPAATTKNIIGLRGNDKE